MFQRVRGVEKNLVNSVVGVKVIYGGPSGESDGRRADRKPREMNPLSSTEFHSCVEFSFDIDIIPFAVPLRIKSAWYMSESPFHEAMQLTSFTLLMYVS
jgi:hypothetical protein